MDKEQKERKKRVAEKKKFLEKKKDIVIDPSVKVEIKKKKAIEKAGEMIQEHIDIAHSVMVKSRDKDLIARESELLMTDWAIRFPTMTPRDYLIIERGYGVSKTNTLLHESGGADEWALRRTEIQNKMTESVIKRHVDQVAEFNDNFIKGAKVGMAKGLEMLSKFSVEPARDKDGKILLDGKGKPIHRGFRSIDLLNVLNSLKVAQDIWRKGLGINDNEGGMSQLIEKVTQLTELQKREISFNQTNISLTVNPIKEQAEKKLEEFVKEMSYEDIRTFVEYHKQKDENVIDVESNEKKA